MKRRAKRIKGGLSVLLVVCLLMPLASWTAYAEEQDSSTKNSLIQKEQGAEVLREGSVSYECVYHSDKGIVTLSGSISHETMIHCRDYTIEIYRLLPNETADLILTDKECKPLASAEITVKFSFTLTAQTASDRFSGYLVALRAPSGELFLTEHPVYIQIPSSEAVAQKDPLEYKGLSFADASVGSTLGTGTTVIPVDLDQVLSKTSAGYLYHVDQGYQYFDKEYVDRLDATIRSYAVTGCKVYLQLLLPASGLSMAISETADPTSQYYMPNMYSHQILQKIIAISSFLVSRYDDEHKGQISGLILGSRIDQKEYNDHGRLLTNVQYAEMYSYYFLVVGASARAIRSDLELVIPFSDTNDYKTPVKNTYYSPSDLLRQILGCLTRMGSKDVSCMTMIESTATPCGINEEFLTEKNWEPETDPTVLSVDSMKQYEEYLDALSRQYDNAPHGYLYRWTPKEEMKGTALTCAYSYGYYASLREKGPDAFIVSLSSQEQINDLAHIFRYIDTAESFSVTQSLLPYFRAENWGDLIQGISGKNVAVRKNFTCNLLSQSADHFRGAFAFLDFSKGNLGDWFVGVSAAEVKAGHNTSGVRGVYALINNSSSNKYGELICNFEYPESLVYTPYVEFLVEIATPEISQDALYELTVTIGCDAASAIGSKILYGGEQVSMVLNIQGYSEAYLAEYLKFSVRPLSAESEGYQLWILGMNGFSSDYSSEDLAGLIAAERAKIRDQRHSDEENTKKQTTIWITLGILLLITAVGLFLASRFKAEDRDKNKDAEKNGPSAAK